MTMSIAVEAVEKGDRIELWVGSAPKAVVVHEITEGTAIRTFKVSLGDVPFELSAQRGQAVTLTC